jgi:puromycin-sensitive aminopeptidase
MVLRFRDAAGVKEQAVLLRDAQQRVTLNAEGPVAWCLANGGARGFFRAAYDATLLGGLVAAIRQLGPEERLGLVSDQWALVRAGETQVGGFLDLVAGLGGETDHVVLDEILTRLSIIEHRHVADADRDRFQALVADLFAAAAAELGWGGSSSGPGGDDETRLRRASVLRAVVILARVPAAIAEAEAQYEVYIRSQGAGAPAGAGVDPNLLDVVVTAAARVAGPDRFEELRRRARTETDPAAKRRFLHALARVESPALTSAAVELAMTDEIPMQDFTSYVGVLLSNRATREEAWTLMRTRWAAVRAKADSPMLARRLIEALSTLPERRHLDEVRQFLDAHPVEGTKQATAQTLERLQMDAALRERLMPAIAGWLSQRSRKPE